jgi:four helix bundle protein
MATIRRFQDIEAWKKARELARAVYACSNKGPFATDYGLRGQIRRAAVSILSNIAEGFERGGNAEFVQFLSVAKGSAGEVEAQLYVALDQRYISKEDFARMQQLVSSTRRLLAGLMSYLKGSGLRGQKYKQPLRDEPATRNQEP